ncbi:hypothetical protein MMC10_009338 [Thelotrema lepadinum]|nr:hypothetical protein [Thelotrema lepadinum]
MGKSFDGFRQGLVTQFLPIAPTSTESYRSSIPNGLTDDTKSPSRPATPSNYMTQPADWFRRGRYFKIYALQDLEIHEKHFVLLDSKNSEGKGVLVKTLAGDELEQKAEFRLSHTHGAAELQFRADHPSDGTIIVGNDSEQGGFEVAYMDRYSRREVTQDTYILLEHTYNIPFKYKCEDCGMLDDDSLDDLRTHYVKYLIYNWRLTSRFKHVGE